MSEDQLKEQDYFSVDAISKSRLDAIDPEMNGSPTKYLNFINQDEERKISIDMERGSLIHKYVEDPKKFIVLEVDKPSDKLGEVADYVINNFKENTDKAVLSACRTIGWNPKWGDEAILKNTQILTPYIEQMLQPNISDKIVMTKKTKEVVEACKNSLENHEIATKLLLQEASGGMEIFKEKNIYWVKNDLLYKIKPDNFKLDFDNKIVYLTDLKSGAFNVGNFDGTFKYRRIYRQIALYKKGIFEYCLANNINISEWKWEMNIVAVETKDEFRTAVFPVNDLWVFKGRDEYEALVARVLFHKQHGFIKSMEEYNNNGYMLLKNPE